MFLLKQLLKLSTGGTKQLPFNGASTGFDGKAKSPGFLLKAVKKSFICLSSI